MKTFISFIILFSFSLSFAQDNISVQVNGRTYYCSGNNGGASNNIIYYCSCDMSSSYTELNYMKMNLETGSVEEIREFATYWENASPNGDHFAACQQAYSSHGVCKRLEKY